MPMPVHHHGHVELVSGIHGLHAHVLRHEVLVVLGPLAVLLVVDNALFFVKSTIFGSFLANVLCTPLLRWRVADLYIFSDGRMEVLQVETWTAWTIVDLL